jgi:hypothetical protein
MTGKEILRLIAGVTGCIFIICLLAVPACAADSDYDGLSDSLEEYLMERFAPVVYLHPDEEYHPSDVEWYLDRVALVHGSEAAIVLEKGEVNAYTLISQVINSKHPDNEATGSHGSGTLDIVQYSGYGNEVTTYRLRHAGSALAKGVTRMGCEANGKDLPVGSPCYVHVRPVVGYPEMIDITYWFFYPYQGDYPISPGLNCGSHEGDWEHITVRVGDNGTTIHQVFFGRHTSSEGQWMNPSEVTFIQGTHPVVYSARYSHASYATAGKTDRAWNADDYTSGDGPVWDTRGTSKNMGELNAPYPGMDWIRFTGRWGIDEFNTPFSGDSPETPTMKSCWMRDDVATGEILPDHPETAPEPLPVVTPALDYITAAEKLEEGIACTYGKPGAEQVRLFTFQELTGMGIDYAHLLHNPKEYAIDTKELLIVRG